MVAQVTYTDGTKKIVDTKESNYWRAMRKAQGWGSKEPQDTQRSLCAQRLGTARSLPPTGDEMPVSPSVGGYRRPTDVGHGNALRNRASKAPTKLNHGCRHGTA